MRLTYYQLTDRQRSQVRAMFAFGPVNQHEYEIGTDGMVLSRRRITRQARPAPRVDGWQQLELFGGQPCI